MQTKKSIEKVLFMEELVKGILGADERCSKPKMKTTARGPFTFTNANNNSTVEISHGSIIEATNICLLKPYYKWKSVYQSYPSLSYPIPRMLQKIVARTLSVTLRQL
jgi:hypothetical protein